MYVCVFIDVLLLVFIYAIAFLLICYLYIRMRSGSVFVRVDCTRSLLTMVSHSLFGKGCMWRVCSRFVVREVGGCEYPLPTNHDENVACFSRL